MLSISIVVFKSVVAVAFDDTTKMLGVIAESYAQNREAFPIVACDFSLQDGESESIEDAVAGNWSTFPYRRTGEWRVDGERTRYTLTCDERETAANEAALRENQQNRAPGESGELELPAGCDNRTVLRGAGYSLEYGPLLLTANLSPVGERFGEGIRMTPFNMEVFGMDEYSNPARYIRESLRGRWPCEVSSEVINEVALLMVHVQVTPTDDGGYVGPVFGFDPTRGYLPCFVSLTHPSEKQPWAEVHVLDAKRYDGDRWFPMEVLKVFDPNGPPPFRVQRLIVNSVDVREPASAEEFQVSLPVRVQISTPGKSQWVTLTEGESFDPEGLPALETRMIENVAAYKAQFKESATPVSTPRRNDYRWMIYLNLALLAGVVAVVFVRRRRRSGPSTAG